MSNISSFGSRLLKLRQGRAWTQKRMAKELGIGRATVAHYEKGRRMPSLEVLERISRVFDVDIDWLLTGRPGGRFEAADLPQPVVRFSSRMEEDPNGFNTVDYRAVPLLSDPVAAGAPLISSDLVEEWAWIHTSQVGRRQGLVAIRIDGDSMSPLIRHGDIIAIDRDDATPPGIFAVRADEGVTVKRVKMISDGLLLIPENRAYEERFLKIPGGQSISDIILGRAVWQWSSMAGI